jgi:uncharacterized protein YdiU (UPF0061 family)
MRHGYYTRTFDEDTSDFLNTFSGTHLSQYQPFALCYAGHQFGNWADTMMGKAINLTRSEEQT